MSDDTDATTRKRLRDPVIRRRAIETLRSADVTAPLDVELLCRRVGDMREQPIVLVPYSLPDPTVFGLWLGTATADLILYEQDATAEHQRHIILHELGHIVLGHDGGGAGRGEALRTLLPDVPLDFVRRALGRSAYTSADEYEAEQFASVVSTWAASSAVTDASRTALERAFDDPRGWL